MRASGSGAKEIAAALGVTVSTVHADVAALKLPRQRRTSSGGDVAAMRRGANADKGRAAARDRRRFKTASVPLGAPSMALPRDHPAAVDGTPLFPSRVFVPDGAEPILKDGASNAKIGGDVLVGRLEGAILLTLTLPERTTCPRSCAMWLGCYGNAMQYARRWQPGPDLEAALRDEVPEWCAKNRLVLVRLHVLGDFYSMDYLRLWVELLDENPGLHVFGFTAHGPETEIGSGIQRVRAEMPERFAIRFSNLTGRWGSFVLPFPTDANRIGDAIVCPEQRSSLGLTRPGIHCGSCGLCWSTDRPIAFIAH